MSFELTLSHLQERLQNRLLPDFSKIWFQGYSHPSNTTILFTIFNQTSGYTIRSIKIRNFRNYRVERNQESIDRENNFLETYINSNFKETLQDFISYE
jgi:hypothetical protein